MRTQGIGWRFRDLNLWLLRSPLSIRQKLLDLSLGRRWGALVKLRNYNQQALQLMDGVPSPQTSRGPPGPREHKLPWLGELVWEPTSLAHPW